MTWTKKQIEQHKKAANVLVKIVREFTIYVKKNSDVTEYEAALFVKKLFKKHNLKSDRTNPIIAFRENTSFVHYYPKQKSKFLKPESLILFDLWGRVNAKGAPYADITWMLYFGNKIPPAVEKVFLAVVSARNEAVKFFKKNLNKEYIPTGKEIDQHVRDYLQKYKLSDKFLHSTGHSLGFSYVHGNGAGISRRGRQSLPMNIGYTIEPGVYFKNKLGVRSEIDFYIDNNYNLVITSAVQKKIIKI